MNLLFWVNDDQKATPGWLLACMHGDGNGDYWFGEMVDTMLRVQFRIGLVQAKDPFLLELSGTWVDAVQWTDGRID